MSASKENGLELFDDTASAVGNFPSALRGYDRTAVDDYVRSLERAVVKTRRRAATLEQQVGTLQDKLAVTIQKLRAQEIDFTNLGIRASDILRLAEEQAREVTDQAGIDAERLREEARREADQARAEAGKAGAEIKSRGLAEIESLRARGQADIAGQVERATADATAVVAAARRQAEALQRAAEHETQTLRQNAYLDTEGLRRSVEREVAQIRAEIATERESAITHLRGVHDESVAKTTALLADATRHSQQASDRLDADLADAARIRAEALAEAEQLRVQAAQEAEDRVMAARKQAAAITDRTQQEFAWRKQQLRRETELLGQRKQAVLNQLASLNALAEQTAQSFPDIDELEDFDAEQDDRTQVMPAVAGPALPEGLTSEPTEDDAQSGEGGSQMPQSEEAQSESPHSENPQSEADTEELEVDGDTTILVPAASLPAGTAHLARPDTSKG